MRCKANDGIETRSILNNVLLRFRDYISFVINERVSADSEPPVLCDKGHLIELTFDDLKLSKTIAHQAVFDLVDLRLTRKWAKSYHVQALAGFGCPGFHRCIR